MNVALLRANFKVQKIDTKAELMVANPFHITKNQGHLQPLATKTKVKLRQEMEFSLNYKWAVHTYKDNIIYNKV